MARVTSGQQTYQCVHKMGLNQEIVGIVGFMSLAYIKFEANKGSKNQ